VGIPTAMADETLCFTCCEDSLRKRHEDLHIFIYYCVLQCVAVCYGTPCCEDSLRQRHEDLHMFICYCVLQCVAVCCSVLQCVIEWCIVVHCGALWRYCWGSFEGKRTDDLFAFIYCMLLQCCSDVQWRICMCICAIARERHPTVCERHQEIETSKERDIRQFACVHVDLRTLSGLLCCTVSRCVAVPCNVAVLQCVAVCPGTLQCVARCRNGVCVVCVAWCRNMCRMCVVCAMAYVAYVSQWRMCCTVSQWRMCRMCVVCAMAYVSYVCRMCVVCAMAYVSYVYVKTHVVQVI